MNITNELITESVNSMFTKDKEVLSLFVDLLLESLLC
jgi:hypothetical protein